MARCRLAKPTEDGVSCFLLFAFCFYPSCTVVVLVGGRSQGFPQQSSSHHPPPISTSARYRSRLTAPFADGIPSDLQDLLGTGLHVDLISPNVGGVDPTAGATALCGSVVVCGDTFHSVVTTDRSAITESPYIGRDTGHTSFRLCPTHTWHTATLQSPLGSRPCGLECSGGVLSTNTSLLQHRLFVKLKSR